MSFLDAYRGYHQIAMHDLDEEKLYHPRKVFCYKVMPLGLKNARATYQRMLNKTFGHLMGNTIDAYIDDIVVKKREGSFEGSSRGVQDLERA